MYDYVIEFLKFGFKDIILEFYQQVLKINVLEIVNQGFLSQKRKIALHALIQIRIKELHDALQIL